LNSGGYSCFRNGDILFAKITPCTENGKIALVQNLPDDVGLGSTEFIVISPSETIDGRFLFYQLTRGDIRALCASLMEGTTGRQRVPSSIFRKRIQIPVPTSRDEQKVIADAFELVDSAITAARGSIEKAKQLQKSLMQQLLTGVLKPDGTTRRKTEFCGHPKMGLVPNGWSVSPLKALAEIQRGRFSCRPRNEPRFFGGPYPFIQTADIVSSRGYIRRHAQTLNEEGRRISRMFPKGSIMITIAANIGDTAIAAYDVFATDSVIGITPKGGMDSEFLELCLRMRKGYLKRMATESAQANINYGNLRPLLIAHPPTIQEQREIAEPIWNCERLILAKEDKIAALQRLKKSLMQNLLTGRIRLPVPTEPKEVVMR
jgi:type I restriction enzyme S subunit